ncbi:transcription initiation factor IIA, gamma subunit [Anaeromyces robustus]|uniref:Transcription initiation factor IIA subunit 2 n=1 Tax=Anaeromyces robustus TaxID=1754192 RepID=A0A1Y1WXH4_9FUNG|nr:transcription initiation factor IIA, gamma subunit [Anaeromyces robustus]|eukprot:ORX77906.1 transcription initiation factor IIA, gamma subunit [Anaeromyces robustus]
MTQYELYRRSSVGIALTDTLDEMISSSLIDPQLAMKIMRQFDLSMAEALQKNVRCKAGFKGHLDTYRFCDDVWTFLVVNPSFRFESETIVANKIKVVACAGKRATDAEKE